MAAITYRSDIAPHLKLGLIYRRLRMQRWQVLHRSCRDYDPYEWAQNARTFDLIAGIAALVWLVMSDSEIVSRFKSGRLLAHAGL